MRILVDAMGGDNAPREIVLGTLRAREELGIEIVLVGKEDEIKPYLGSTKGIEIVNSSEIITNDDEPVKAIRRKKDSSMVKGLKLLKEGRAQAMVSAGSTGALMAGGLFIVGRLEGIHRPAIAAVIPTMKDPTLLLDIGANSEVKPINLVQFALMGSIYAQQILNKENPSVGLLNIGAEEQKGNSTIKSAFGELKEMEHINFIGNIEPRYFFEGNVDVVICDGFTGNVFIKTIEGFGKYVFDSLKEEIKHKVRYSLGGLLLKPAIKDIKNKMDYSEYGGAMLVGLDGILIKCHGSSDQRAIFNGIKVAKQFAKSDISSKLQQGLKTSL